MDDLTTEIAEGLSAVQGLGADACECLITEREVLRIGWAGRAPSAAQTSHQRTVRVGVWTSGTRVGWAEGSASVTDLGRAALERASDEAAQPVVMSWAAPTGLSIEDRRHGSLEVSDREDLLRSVFASVKEVDKALSVDRLEWSEERVIRCFGSSKMPPQEERGTVYSVFVQVSGSRDGERVTFSATQASRRFASLVSMPIGTRVARRVVNALGEGVSVEPGPVRVMFGSAATARLLACLGKGYAEGELPGGLLTSDGSGVALDRRLHLIDDGKMAGGLRTRAFDDRGMCPQAVMLWRDGQVGARLSALRGPPSASPRPTGHASGDGLRVSNLVLRAGARSLNAIAIARGGPSLYIEDLPEIDTALNVDTGRFDGVVNGRLMDGNQVVGSVRGLRLQGQISEVLSSVVDVASDTDRIGAVDAPGLVVDGFSVSS